MIAESKPFHAATLPGPTLHTTPEDKVTSWLLSCLFCLMLTTMFLGLIWLSGTPQLPRFNPGGTGLTNIELMTGAPLVAQALEVQPPEDPTDDPSLVSETSVEAELIALIEQLGEVETDLIDGPPGANKGSGTGDGDQQNVITVPSDQGRPHRWRFTIDRIKGLDDYAEMMDQFGIELGTFDATGFVYLTNLAAAVPAKRRPTVSRDDRFYTTWQNGTLSHLDDQLFAKASISRTHQIVHFMNADLESRLAELERQATRSSGYKLKDVRRTTFGVRKAGTGYEFYVTRQHFR